MHGCLTAATLRGLLSRGAHGKPGGNSPSSIPLPLPPSPHFWLVTQETSSALCAATKYVCLPGALKDEVSVWTVTATKRRIGSIWSHEQALVACGRLLHMQAASADIIVSGSDSSGGLGASPAVLRPHLVSIQRSLEVKEQ